MPPWSASDDSSMIPPFDIFKIEDDGDITWKGTADSLALARLTVAILMDTAAGADYLIYSAGSRQKIIIKTDGSSVAA
jgi:hypothetical protein